MGFLRPHAQARYAQTGNKWMATALGIADTLRARGQGGVAGPLPGAATAPQAPKAIAPASAGPTTTSGSQASPTMLGGAGGIVNSARGMKTLLGQ